MSIVKEKNDLVEFNKYESTDIIDELLYELGIEASEKQLQSFRNNIQLVVDKNRNIDHNGIPPHRYFKLEDKYEKLLSKHNDLTKKYDELSKEINDSKLVEVNAVEHDLLMLINIGSFNQKLEENSTYIRMRVGEILSANGIVKTKDNYNQIINSLWVKGLIVDASDMNMGNNTKHKHGDNFALSGKNYKLLNIN